MNNMTTRELLDRKPTPEEWDEWIQTAEISEAVLTWVENNPNVLDYLETTQDHDPYIYNPKRTT